MGETIRRITGVFRRVTGQESAPQKIGKIIPIEASEDYGDGKKRSKRHKLVHCPQVFDLDANDCLGEVVNLSRTGARILVRGVFAKGEERNVRISWQRKDSWHSIPVRIRVAWVEPGEETYQHDIGVHFINPAQSIKVRIQKLIQSMSI